MAATAVGVGHCKRKSMKKAVVRGNKKRERRTQREAKRDKCYVTLQLGWVRKRTRLAGDGRRQPLVRYPHFPITPRIENAHCFLVKTRLSGDSPDTQREMYVSFRGIFSGDRGCVD